ncbi:MAG: Hpt domain-containing protein [Magnetococcales bacterium]|nr:Hpt domain-containing protein [Magnetococcales bacterium]
MGMDDHITKPIDRKALFKSLMQWIKPLPPERRQEVKLRPVMEPDSEEERPLVSFPGLDLPGALERVNHNRTLLFSILEEFQRDFATVDKVIAKSLEGRRDNDLENATRLAHSVKGMAGNLSARTLFQAARALESAIRSEEQARWPGLLEGFSKALQEVNDAISESLTRYATPRLEPKTPMEACSPMDLQALPDLVKPLESALEESNIASEAHLSALKSGLAAHPSAEIQELLLHMEEALSMFDFSSALVSLQELKRVLEIAPDA